MPPGMGKDATRRPELETILERALRGDLSEADAQRRVPKSAEPSASPKR